MRRALWTMIVLAALVSGAMASSAFDLASAQRGIGVSIVGDAAAYLEVKARDGPHKCFVDVDGRGKLSILFDSASACPAGGLGTGINAGDGSASSWSRYAFHDILQITNKAPHPLHLWVNATSATAQSHGSAIEVALKTATGQMTDADYAASRALASADLPVGATAYLGVRVKSGTHASGSGVSGSIALEARA
ncbi:MAG TPA: hypothetical protein VFH78_02435 [Candidatus Thermoplasmatota archaeon]|nr:hypothetical protein [Candidatus Thermoplasmatota archaeon]